MTDFPRKCQPLFLLFDEATKVSILLMLFLQYMSFTFILVPDQAKLSARKLVR